MNNIKVFWHRMMSPTYVGDGAILYCGITAVSIDIGLAPLEGGHNHI